MHLKHSVPSIIPPLTAVNHLCDTTHHKPNSQCWDALNASNKWSAFFFLNINNSHLIIVWLCLIKCECGTGNDTNLRWNAGGSSTHTWCHLHVKTVAASPFLWWLFFLTSPKSAAEGRSCSLYLLIFRSSLLYVQKHYWSHPYQSKHWGLFAHFRGTISRCVFVLQFFTVLYECSVTEMMFSVCFITVFSLFSHVFGVWLMGSVHK